MEHDPDLENRFNYHSPNAQKANQHERIHFICKSLAYEIKAYVPEGREQALALKHLEDVMLWADAGIARK